MRKILYIATFFFCFFSTTMQAQEATNDPDAQLKESLYAKFKKEVMAYDRNAFDKLFMEFFQVQSDSKILTKEEFYTYTIKIAIYSEKQGVLYKSQKEEAQRAKKEWFDRSYQEYLNSKK